MLEYPRTGRFLLLVAFCTLTFLPLFASDPTDIPQISSVFASPDLPNPLTTDRLTLCIAETKRTMHLDDREAPQIVILQLSPAEARRFGMSSNYVLSNKDPQHPNRFYEVWLVGPNGTADLAQGVVSVFELHFGVTLSPQERAQVIKLVVAHLNGTVDAKTLRQSKNLNR